jgi:hypothetical protein
VVRGLSTQFRVCEKTEWAHAVGNAHQHHTLASQVFAVVDRGGGGTKGKPAAVDPDKHGQALVRGFCRRPDIQIQAVLTNIRFGARTLNRIWRKLGGLACAFPFCSGLRSTPAEITDRWRGERDAEIDRQAILSGALEESIFGHDGWGLLCKARRGGSQDAK